MLSFSCQPCTQLQTHKSLRFISASSPFSCSDKTQRKKTRRSTATAARGKEQTMAEQMITSESGKQQKFTVFAPFCSAVLAFHFGQFNPLCVGPAKMTEKTGKKPTENMNLRSKRGKSVICGDSGHADAT